MWVPRALGLGVLGPLGGPRLSLGSVGGEMDLLSAGGGVLGLFDDFFGGENIHISPKKFP